MSNERTMGATTGALWSPELVLPASTSAAPWLFEFKTRFLPHSKGRLLIKNDGQEQEIEVVAYRLIEFEIGTVSEIVNATDQELRFTVIEFK
jgi:hypothetical protein